MNAKRLRIKAARKPDARYAQTLKTKDALVRRLPGLRKLAEHPKLGPWLPALVAVGEVLVPLAIAAVVSILVASLVFFVLPNLPLPDINLPDINLPAIPVPDYLTTLYRWLKITLPIWIAVYFVWRAIKKHRKTNIK